PHGLGVRRRLFSLYFTKHRPVCVGRSPPSWGGGGAPPHPPPPHNPPPGPPTTTPPPPPPTPAAPPTLHPARAPRPRAPAPGASQYVRSSAWKLNGVSVRLYAPLRAMPARKRSECARRFAVMNAPYEWPEMAIRSRSPTPRRTSSSTAAFAPATSCSTYESFG